MVPPNANFGDSVVTAARQLNRSDAIRLRSILVYVGKVLSVSASNSIVALPRGDSRIARSARIAPFTARMISTPQVTRFLRVDGDLTSQSNHTVHRGRQFSGGADRYSRTMALRLAVDAHKTGHRATYLEYHASFCSLDENPYFETTYKVSRGIAVVTKREAERTPAHKMLWL